MTQIIIELGRQFGNGPKAWYELLHNKRPKWVDRTGETPRFKSPKPLGHGFVVHTNLGNARKRKRIERIAAWHKERTGQDVQLEFHFKRSPPPKPANADA